MNSKVKVADQAWIAAALLHKENPHRQDFRVAEIFNRAMQEFGRSKHKGVKQHISSHSVASNAPTPATYRMLTATSRGMRRLFRDGDSSNASRSGKFIPEAADIPAKYHSMLEWYKNEYNQHSNWKKSAHTSKGDTRPEAFLALVGLIPAYDLKLMEEAIERDCERIEVEADESAA